MKNFTELANTVYKNAKTLTVNKDCNNDSIFLQEWFTTNKVNPIHRKAGWYWIDIIDFNYEDFINLKANNSQKQGCKIPETYKKNTTLLVPHLISKVCFYNGHADNLRSRLRAHFNLTNDYTGALGLNAYSELKKYNFRIKLFTEEMVSKLDVDEETKNCIKKLIKNKRGRTIIETSWRAINGFPVLCKA